MSIIERREAASTRHQRQAPRRAPLVAAVLATALTVPLQAQVPADCVDVYEDFCRSGESLRFCGDGEHVLPYDPATGVNWHYRVSSFECGDDVERVTFTDGNRPGVTAEVQCAGDGLLTAFNDQATSLTFLTTSPPEPSPLPAGCVDLFELDGQAGQFLRLCGAGDHALPYDPVAGVDWHYRVSSFRCGDDVDTLHFVDGNRPGLEATVPCAGDGSLSTFDDQATSVEIGFERPDPPGFVCAPWDGGVPPAGSKLRFTNAIVKEPHDYRTDLAGKFLVNRPYGSGAVIPQFVGTDATSEEALYEVVESRAGAHGPEIRLRSPAVGHAAGQAVGFNHAEMITAEHSYWSIMSDWMRLAHTYRAWTDPDCGHCAATVSDKTAPTAVLQRLAYDGGRSCYQEYANGLYHFIECNGYYVSFGGYGGESNRHLARYASDVDVEVCSSPVVRSCADLPAESPDGFYTLVDSQGTEREAYCDMTNGGWMLAGKVPRSHQGTSSLAEPADWWTAGTAPAEAIAPGTVDWNHGLGVIAYGTDWLRELGATVARFDLIAEDAAPFSRIQDAAPGETASWYKDASTLETWFTPLDDVATAVCDDEALTCGTTGRIQNQPDAVWLEGMRLDVGGGDIHLRVDGNEMAYFDGVCSYTGGSASWADDAGDHWGNGLDIWVK